MIQRVFASEETKYIASKSPNKSVKVYSLFPNDRADCACQPMVAEWKKKMGQASEKDRQEIISQHPFFVCPRDKTGMDRYKIVCNNCKAIQGYCWSPDATLQDWCDFHYIQWTVDDYWHGCFTPHISPISQQLCFECCCGQDTRDFRANMRLPQRQAQLLEDKNKVGRTFGQPDSKFSVKKVSPNVIV